MKKVIFMLLTVCWLSLPLAAQSSKQSFNFVYIDNSRFAGDEGFSSKLREQIFAQFKSLENDKSANFLIFLSNGKSFTSTSDKNDFESLTKTVNFKQTSTPNDFNDYEQVVKELKTAMDDTYGTIKMDFYISKYYCKLITSGSYYLMGMLPKTICFTSPKCENAQIKINIYFSDPTANNTEERLLETLVFQKEATQACKTNYSVSRL